MSVSTLVTTSPKAGGPRDEIGSDPFAYILCKIGLLGPGLKGRLVWPTIFGFVYFVVNDILLPILLGRFATTPNYIGPFDPRLLPNRIVDVILVPLIVYYYGRVSLELPHIFNELERNGVFGPVDANAETDQQTFHRNLFRRWAGSIIMTPLAIAAAVIAGLEESFDFASPPHAHSFINSDPIIFGFNVAMWVLLAYMIAAIFSKYILLTFWLIRLQFVPQKGRFQVDILNPDGRMGFSPITNSSVLVAKIFTVALLAFVFILKGARNIGLSLNGPDWPGYVGIIVLSIPFVLLPIYLVHRAMLHERERILHEFDEDVRYPHTSTIILRWDEIGDQQRQRWHTAQVMLLRLAQVKDWPITLDEAATVFFTYLLGTVFTILSTLQSIVSFLSR